MNTMNRQNIQEQRRTIRRSYIAGLLSGLFLSCVLYFGLIPNEVPSEEPKLIGEDVASDVKVDAPIYTFYGTLSNADYISDKAVANGVKSEATVDSSDKSQTENYYILQAGSFRHEEDADSRRAELIILGLAPTIEKFQGDQGLWYRVSLGPFTSKSDVFEARSLAESQDIDTMILIR